MDQGSSRLGKAALILVGLAYLGLALKGLTDPVGTAGLSEIRLETPNAIADGRAVWGFLNFGFGIMLLIAAFVRVSGTQLGLLIIVLSVGPQLIGHFYGIAADGASGPGVWNLIYVEAIVTAVGMVGLVAESRRRKLAARPR